MQHRSWLILASTFFWTPALMAQDLTLNDVMATLASDTSRVEARTKLTQANFLDAESQGRWDAPNLHSGLDRVADESEFSLTVAQRFDLSGNRGRERNSASAHARSLEASSRRAQIEDQARAAEVFFEAVFINEKIALIQTRAKKLVDAEASIRRRVEAGDASVFELEWIQRELRNTHLGLKQTEAELDLAMGRLAAIVPVNADASVKGELDAQCSIAEQPRPEIVALQHRLDAQQIDVDRAQAAWIPSVELEAGWKAISSSETNHGFIVGLGLTLPLWSAPTVAVDAAQARLAGTQAEMNLLNRTRTEELRSSTAACETLLKIADDRAAAAKLTQHLSDRASAGYAAGELSLLEWLNAEEGVLEDQMTTLESRLQAKRLENQIRQLSGGW